MSEFGQVKASWEEAWAVSGFDDSPEPFHVVAPPCIMLFPLTILLARPYVKNGKGLYILATPSGFEPLTLRLGI